MDSAPEQRISTRHAGPPIGPEFFTRPRLGRRESEPHSQEITYIYEVLTHNFPEDRVTWDLHHYFFVEGKRTDVQYDVSFFRGFKLDEDLSSYDASKFGNRVPTVAFNVLSRSTFNKDIGYDVEVSRAIGVPVYLVFLAYPIPGFPFDPPFCRAYLLGDDGYYAVRDLRELSVDESGKVLPEKLVDLGGASPFKVGLVPKDRRYFPNLPEYRLVFVDAKTGKVLRTEKEELREALREKDRVIEEKDRLIGEKDRVIEEKDRLIEELKKKLGD
ncbi:MAG: hypothetical protein Kow0069_06060 [Promethearchaeota archaeon]